MLFIVIFIENQAMDGQHQSELKEQNMIGLPPKTVRRSM